MSLSLSTSPVVNASQTPDSSNSPIDLLATAGGRKFNLINVIRAVQFAFMDRSETAILEMKQTMDVRDYKSRCIQVGIAAAQSSQKGLNDDDWNILQPVDYESVMNGPNDMKLPFTPPSRDEVGGDDAKYNSAVTKAYFEQVLGLKWNDGSSGTCRGPDDDHAADVETGQLSAWVSSLQSSQTTNSNANSREMIDLNSSIKQYSTASDMVSEVLTTGYQMLKSIIGNLNR
ncbi:hypothetical protein PQR68_31495 [Paraburkholderia agricolaris]|uniref:hypothetical protein n=1 Tax=Paraburkholderia agricolaris TaxID=2152888 RepID=UPI001292385A|nr:hypothetical protein [Paraburkholderia agricolaris]